MRENLLFVPGKGDLDANGLGDDWVVAVAVRGDGGALGEERRRDVGRQNCLLSSPRKDGVEALGNGVTPRAEAVGVVGGGDSDSGVDGVEDAGSRAVEEHAPVLQGLRRRRHIFGWKCQRGMKAKRVKFESNDPLLFFLLLKNSIPINPLLAFETLLWPDLAVPKK